MDTKAKCACFHLLDSDQFFHDGDNTNCSKRAGDEYYCIETRCGMFLPRFDSRLLRHIPLRKVHRARSTTGGAPGGTPPLSGIVVRNMLRESSKHETFCALISWYRLNLMTGYELALLNANYRGGNFFVTGPTPPHR